MAAGAQTSIGGQVQVRSLTITNGQSLSPSIDLGVGRLAAIQMPAAWTAANITFQVSADGVTFADFFDSSGTEYVVTAAASRVILLTLVDLLSLRFVKVRSGTTGAPVAQGADRTLLLTMVR